MKSPLKQNGTKGSESNIEFLKTDYAKGQGVGDRIVEEKKPEGKFLATKTKLIKKKTLNQKLQEKKDRQKKFRKTF